MQKVSHIATAQNTTTTTLDELLVATAQANLNLPTFFSPMLELSQLKEAKEKALDIALDQYENFLHYEIGRMEGEIGAYGVVLEMLEGKANCQKLRTAIIAERASDEEYFAELCAIQDSDSEEMSEAGWCYFSQDENYGKFAKAWDDAFNAYEDALALTQDQGARA